VARPQPFSLPHLVVRTYQRRKRISRWCRQAGPLSPVRECRCSTANRTPARSPPSRTIYHKAAAGRRQCWECWYRVLGFSRPGYMMSQRRLSVPPCYPQRQMRSSNQPCLIRQTVLQCCECVGAARALVCGAGSANHALPVLTIVQLPARGLGRPRRIVEREADSPSAVAAGAGGARATAQSGIRRYASSDSALSVE
jgi:hypothetical protein